MGTSREFHMGSEISAIRFQGHAVRYFVFGISNLALLSGAN
jgi:hypothetical protein